MTTSGMFELSRPVLVRTLRDATVDAPREIVVTASAKECERIAARLGLPQVAALSCRYELHSEFRGNILAEGALTAKLSQVCVRTLEEFEDVIGERFTLRFVPESRFREEDSFGSLGENLDSIDEIPYDGTTIDLGEATVEQLSLILDPYPRRPGDGLPKGILSEDDASLLEEEQAAEEGERNPFAALDKLRREKK
ncbi:YceD family protein [Acetobacter sp.]|uniref:YceD family protein n=1 Tax=Acetobacter sp. TaxID=440 RepID=UPI0039E733B3